MAENSSTDVAAADNAMILADRQRSWAGFVRFATWGVGLTVGVLLLLLIFVV